MDLKLYSIKTVLTYGSDILSSENMQREKQYIQHGKTNVFEHSVKVACLSIYISAILKIKVNTSALVRGALLHDYFMYDWHTSGSGHHLHGFTHATCALNNAIRDFNLNQIEKDIIKKHMFPLNITPPKYRESIIVCIADKISAICETLNINCFAFKSTCPAKLNE